MEGVPEGIDTKKLLKEINEIDEVHLVHDFHLWSMSQGQVAMSAHVNSNQHKVALEKVTNICKKYNIFHTTIQIEEGSCGDCGNDLHEHVHH